MNLYAQALDNYAVFKGRATRAEYWTFILLNNVIVYTLSLISFKMGWTSITSSGTNEYAPLGVVFWLFILIPVISVSIRRIHDIGLSGWWGWLFIPLMLPMLIVALIPSKKDKTSRESRASLSKAVTNHAKEITNELKVSKEIYIEKHTQPSNSENENNALLDDDILYEYVLLHEIEEDNKVKSTWAKALAYSDGNAAKAESMYMQNRVKTITEQINTLNIAYNEMSKEDLFDDIKDEFKDYIAERTRQEEARELEEERKLEEQRKIENERKLEEEKNREELKIREMKNDDAFFYVMLSVVIIFITVFIFS